MLFTIIILSTLLGSLLAADKKKRMNVFKELYEFNERLILNMNYGKSKISNIAADFKYVGDLMSGKAVLSGADGEFIKNYVSNLGTTDATSQLEYLNERKSALSKLKSESEENYKKYSSMYVKISLMVGILIAVLLA